MENVLHLKKKNLCMGERERYSGGESLEPLHVTFQCLLLVKPYEINTTLLFCLWIIATAEVCQFPSPELSVKACHSIILKEGQIGLQISHL